VIKHIILDLFVGGAVLGFNMGLSKLTQFNLNKQILAAITAGAIASRILYSGCILLKQKIQSEINKAQDAKKKEIEKKAAEDAAKKKELEDKKAAEDAAKKKEIEDKKAAEDAAKKKELEDKKAAEDAAKKKELDAKQLVIDPKSLDLLLKVLDLQKQAEEAKMKELADKYKNMQIIPYKPIQFIKPIESSKPEDKQKAAKVDEVKEDIVESAQEDEAEEENASIFGRLTNVISRLFSFGY
jgi:hypothetical protein